MMTTLAKPAAGAMAPEIGLERQLREALLDARLVCEINLTEELYQRTKASMEMFVRSPGWQERVERLYPATLVVYLVAEGLRTYDGTYWDKLAVPLKPGWAGPAFLAALQVLRLPPFEEETEAGFRYISKILFHGGIPRFCAGDVLRLIARTLTYAPGDAAELHQRWTRDPDALERLDRPAQRFLLHGGTESLALVNRMIDLFRRANDKSGVIDEIGLPSYLVEEFHHLPPDVRRSGKGLVRPRPRVELQEQSGPVILLPPHPAGSALTWRVTADGRTSVYSGSASQSLSLPVFPGGRWRVDLDDDHRRYRFELRGHRTAPVYFFDAIRRNLLTRQDALEAGTVLALLPKRFEVSWLDSGEHLQLQHDHPPLEGGWSSYKILSLNLVAGRSIRVADPVDAQAPVVTVPITAPPAVPKIQGTLLAGVWARGTAPVYAGDVLVVIDSGARPGAYTVRVRSELSGLTHTGNLSSLRCVDGRFVLPQLADGADLVVVDVVGPLGSELRGARLCRVDADAACDVPPGVVAPADAVQVDALIGGELVSVELAAGVRQVVLPVVDCPVELTVEVARLGWSMTRPGVGSPIGIEPVTLIPADLAGEAPMIVVRCAPNCEVTLSLRSRKETLQVETRVTRDDSDLVSFGLSCFSDTVRLSEDGQLSWVLTVTDPTHSFEERIGRVLSTFQASDLAVTGEGRTLRACWSENKSFPDRTVQLWSALAADAPLQRFVVPEQARGRSEWSLSDRPECWGPYIACLTIDDGWGTHVRPEPGPSVCFVKVPLPPGEGTTSPASPASVLVAHVADDAALTSEPDLRVLTMGATWLCHEALYAGRRVIFEADGRRLRELLFDDPDAGVAGILECARTWQGSERALRILEIALLDDALTVPARSIPEQRWAELAERFPLLWATMRSDASVRGWHAVTGWSSSEGTPPEAGVGVHESMVRRPALANDEAIARLLENTRGTARDPALPLSFGRQQQGVFEWLRDQSVVDHSDTVRWQQAYSDLNDSSVKRLSPRAARAIDRLLEGSARAVDPAKARLCRFPADLIACAVHVVYATAAKDEALAALVEAACFAPALAGRAPLFVIALRSLDGSRAGS